MSSIKLFLAALFLLQALALDPNCQITTPGGDCMICNDKFFIKNGLCTSFTSHCSSGDVVSGLCNSCEPGFNLVNQVCVPGSGSGSDSSVTSASLQSLSSSFGSSGSSSSGSSQFGQQGLGTTVTNTTTVTTTTSIGTVPFCSIPGQNGGCIACQLGYNLVGNSCVPVQTSQSSQSSQSNQQSLSASSSGQFLNSQFSGIQPLNVIVPTTTSMSDMGGSSTSSQFSQFTTSQPQVIQPLVTNTNTNQNQFSSQFNQFGQDFQSQPTFVQQQPLISQAPMTPSQTTVQTVTTQTTQQASPPIYQPQPQTQPILNQQTSQFQQSNQFQQNTQQGLQTQTQAQYRQDPYCASFSPSGSCLRCSNRYYFSNSGACVPISGNCNTYDDRTGGCTSCYPTFVLQNGECYIQVASSSQTDPNCKTYSGNICR